MVLGMVYGAVLPALIFAFVVFKQQHVGLGKEHLALYFGAIAINLIGLRFAYRYSAERLAKGLMSSSFIIFLLVFYLAKYVP